MSIRPNDIYRATIRWRKAEQQCINTLHYRRTTTALPSGVNNALNDLLSRLATLAGQMAQQMGDDITIDKIGIVAVHGQTNLYARDMDVAVDGARTGELLPGFVASPIFLFTDFAGRSRRGRWHQGGLIEEDQNAGVLTAAAITRMETLRDNLLSATQLLSSWEGIIYSPTIAAEFNIGPNDDPGSDGGAVGVPWAPITAAGASPILGSMYSRRIGIGS